MNIDKEDIANRTIYIYENIDNKSISKACSTILEILRQDEKEENKLKDFTREPIKIYIQSYGGSVYDMWALIDLMLTSKTPIYTYCMGYAMSAGFKIFIAGSKRFIGKHATLMYHQLNHCIWGDFKTMDEQHFQNTLVQDDIENYVLSRTKITKERLEEVRNTKINWYIRGNEAIELGIADEIIEES